ncbi:MAG TPA: methyltransferase domain-containing protein [Terriglobales bacterium]|nr:methyltransferase domain-containing protein [Terriglobales bacterium]
MSSLFRVAAQRWRESARHAGAWRATREVAADVWGFLHDSTPARRRARYGDIDYDFDSGADTTAANVGWRTRLLAALAGAPYQPTVPAEFREMLQALALDFRAFTFLDIGSGKGRALLLAAEYPFRRIVGVEIAPALHAAAEANLRKWKATHPDSPIEAKHGDARAFDFPAEPLVVYLFNPLPEAALIGVVARLEQSLLAHPRAVYLVYHNPMLEKVVARSEQFRKIGGTHQYAIYRSRQ